ncbi:MAG: VCBS repeat-containing protein [Flavobacteriales bacterium]|nr:VCBS repeat-containing protein [Flavobacteriales bacterium]
MKKIIQLLTLALLAFNGVKAQNFTEFPIYDEEKITGSQDKGSLFDFDNDGDDDQLISGGTNVKTLLVFVNDGTDLDSSFVLYEYVNQAIGDFIISDFDNDGDADIIVLKSTSGEFYLRENIGSGNFSPPVVVLNESLLVIILERGDVDGDGLVDLIFASYSPHQSYWSKNLGGLTFAVADTLIDKNATGSMVIKAIRSVDFEGDGDMDLVTVVGAGTSNVPYVSINDGVGNFATINTPAQAVHGSFSLEDFNGDGYVDFGLSEFISGSNTGKAMIFWNDQSNNFSTSTTLASSNYPTTISAFHAFDFDQDGDQDVLVGEEYGFSAGGGVIFINDGLGNLLILTKELVTVYLLRFS